MSSRRSAEKPVLRQELADLAMMDAKELAALVCVDEHHVYELPIRRVRLSTGRVRWYVSDVRLWMASREEPAPVPRKRRAS